MIFLQTASEINDLSSLGLTPEIMAGLIGAIFVFLLIVLLILIGIYVYTSFAYMAIARKAKYSKPGLVWIPVIGPLIVTSKIARMHWWPILLIALFWISFLGTVGSIIWNAVMIVLGIFSLIWLWRTFEAVGRPGWWVLIMVAFSLIGSVVILASVLGSVPNTSLILTGLGIVILGMLINFVILGIVAWGKSKQEQKLVKK